MRGRIWEIGEEWEKRTTRKIDDEGKNMVNCRGMGKEKNKKKFKGNEKKSKELEELNRKKCPGKFRNSKLEKENKLNKKSNRHKWNKIN